jgi:hypothetical protein
MIKAAFSLRNPFAKDSKSKFNWYKVLALSQNKTFEIQIWHSSSYNLLEIEMDLGWRGHDHAGPNLTVGLFGYELIAKIYDNRHWDYTKGTWETPTPPQIPSSSNPNAAA